MAKQVKVREDNYFAVQGWMVTELKLKGNALMLYAIIYGFSQTTNTAFTGSVDYLCEWLGGVSRPTVINTLDNLVKQGILTKSKYAPVFGEEAPVEAVEEKHEEPQEKAYTVEEVAQILGCSERNVYRNIQSGKLEAVEREVMIPTLKKFVTEEALEKYKAGRDS